MQTDPDKRPEFDDLVAALELGGEALAPFLQEVHAADLANWAPDLSEEQLGAALNGLDTEGRSELLKFAEDAVREEVLALLTIDQIVEVVQEMPADEVVDLLALTDDDRSERVLRSVDFERAQGLRKLARYDEETAGGLMTVDFLSVTDDVHVGDVIKDLRSEEGPAADEGGVFVVDPEGKPIGHVSDRDLLMTPIHTPIRDVMESGLITVGVNDDQEDVAQLVRKYSFAAVPVVDFSGALIGVISAEDAQEVLQEEAEEDILRLVGTSPEVQQTRLPVLTRVRHRLPLQALTVLGGLATARLLGTALPGAEDATVGTDVLRYLPIIIGLAGNVGIQASTILVRAFATGEVAPDRQRSVLASEVLVGFIISLICGAVTMAIATVSESQLPDPLHFGASVGVAIVVAVTWAAFLGSVVPMLCQRWGIDPAIVAGPFLVTLSDVSGAAIFVGVTTLSLGVGV